MKKLYLVVVWRGVDSEVVGPFPDDSKRLYAARNRVEHHGEDVSLSRLDIGKRGVPVMRSFATFELEGAAS